MGRIGIFGGTFNPVHAGHVSLARQVKQLKALDRVLIVPTNQPPHKNCTDLAGNGERYAMCRLAFSGLKGFEVSDLEFRLGGSSYTIITLLELKKQFPDDELFLLVGGDMILSFDTWKDYGEILKNATVLTWARTENEYGEMCAKADELMEKAGGKVEVVSITVTELSSTKVREELQNGGDCSGLINPQVLDFIKEHGLYRQGGARGYMPLLKRMLTPSRLHHSECVARRAADLAKQYGVDPEKARTAGLLHDVLKNRPDNYLLQYFDSNAIILSDIEKNSPPLWHSIAGADYLRHKLGVSDPDILNAVRYHTTARAGMSLLEKIVYIADCISEDRDFDGVDEERELAGISLEKAILHSLKHSIMHLANCQRPLHPDSINAYHSLILEGK